VRDRVVLESMRPGKDQVAITKANRASLLRPALRLSRCESMSPYRVRRRRCINVRLRTGALQPHRIPEHIPLGSEVGSGAIDRFQEHQQIPPLLRG
jgi:hypothetical protein